MTYSRLIKTTHPNYYEYTTEVFIIIFVSKKAIYECSTENLATMIQFAFGYYFI